MVVFLQSGEPRRLTFFGLLVLGALAIFAAADTLAADIAVKTDRNPVKLNESFQLTFTSDASPDGEPDFTPLTERVEIISQSQSSNISMTNGSYSKTVSWTLSVIPKMTGEWSIPPIAFGDDRSTPLTLLVLPETASQTALDTDLFLEVSAVPKNPYVQAQMIYTVQLFRRVDLAQGSLSEPALEAAVIEKLGDDRNFTSRRNGFQYAVTERKYAIFPQKSGPAYLAPIALTAQVLTSGRNRGFFSRQTTRTKRIRSVAINLNVRPVPAAFSGRHWLPAEGLHLKEHWSENPPQVKVGEPITYTLTLLAKGAPLSQLPDVLDFRLSSDDDDALKQYPDQPVLRDKKDANGVTSIREQKTALIPFRKATFRFEGIEVPWWNTKTDRMEVARLPGAQLEALPVHKTKERSEDMVSESIDKPSNIEEQPGNSVRVIVRENGVWKWISLVLALGWTGTLILWWLRGRLRVGDVADSDRAESDGKPIRALKRACRENSPVAAKDALLVWAKLYWKDAPPGSLSALADLCEGNLKKEIYHLSRSLYSPVGGEWSGSDCWNAFREFARKPQKHSTISPSGLEPLFKT